MVSISSLSAVCPFYLSLEGDRFPSLQLTSDPIPKIKREKVRILAILGTSKGIDVEKESRFLLNLQDAETVFLVKPSRAESELLANLAEAPW